MSTAPRTLDSRRGLSQQNHSVTIITDRHTMVVPANAHTMEGFREWATADDFPDRVRVTYLEGEIILDMSNEEINAHVLVKGEIIGVLQPLTKKLRLGKFFPDGMLVTNEAGELSNNPDAAFVTRATLESARARPIPRKGAEHLFRELEGTPDWVLEIVSDSSVQKDTVRLRDAYHRAGIPEYWLIDARGEELTFHILLRRKNGYVAAAVKDGWQRSRVFAHSFRLLRQLDEFGLWEYTLEVNPS